MKNAPSSKAITPATSALNANTSPPVARKKRAGRVAIDTHDATRPNVAGSAARLTSKNKGEGKDNPLAGKDAARSAKPDATPSAKSDPKSAAKSRDTRSAKPAAPNTPRTGRAKLSALDAAALVLADLPKGEAATGIGASDLIDRMQLNGLWQSPGGKTPSATLYAAMVREISAKGEASRFVRVAKGRFTLAAGIMKPAKSQAKPATKPGARA